MDSFLPFKILILKPLFSLLSFPLWWYSSGLAKVITFIKRKIQTTSQRLSLKILLAFLFKPMYGDYSREGRIISFFMRLIHLSFRLCQFVLVIIFSLFLMIFYLFLPVFIVYKLICHLGHFCYYFLFPEII